MESRKNPLALAFNCKIVFGEEESGHVEESNLSRRFSLKNELDGFDGSQVTWGFWGGPTSVECQPCASFVPRIYGRGQLLFLKTCLAKWIWGTFSFCSKICFKLSNYKVQLTSNNTIVIISKFTTYNKNYIGYFECSRKV